ncbi:hypothetical protein ABOM_008734 [Aspergillus bombycis]|uniref:O-methyltransferase C-terminal domain-containing protein n=1 Tax=Aspergillus bombycis TaxID=109264 RepID=A0A1F7ZV49_9EURO|nr:hypothetical protein ABOM_008734 [Aspergillus bombycis]OGM43332.1 hypothetical protein ABOM_008734 [Aspergillus bombycis]
MTQTNPESENPASFPLERLSWQMTKNASIISQFLHAHELPQPSTAQDGPVEVLPASCPQSIRQARQNLIEDALKLFQLAIGPSEFLSHLSTGYQYITCLRWLCHFNIIHHLPLTGSMSYSDLAAKAQVPEQALKSIARMAMTNMLFTEPTPGQIAHSATSALLAANDNMYAWAKYMCDRSTPTAMKMVEAHEKWPGTVRKNETAYNIAFETDLPFFDHLATDSEKTAEFAAYMKNVTTNEAQISSICWPGLIGGIGGSTGHAAIALAKAFPDLIFIVQDLPINVDNGRQAASSTLPPDYFARIIYQAHDFTQPQPVKGAEIYLLRMILHDWPREESVQILRNILPAMSRCSRLLIMDSVLPAPATVPSSVERIMRVRDLTMMQAFNSHERDRGDWEDLLAAADPRLQLVQIVQPFGSVMSVLEVVFRS